MNRKPIAALILSMGLGVTTAFAAPNMMSDGAYKSEKDRIKADHKMDSERCKGFSGNTKDICTAEADGKQKVALAELDARNKNTPQAHEDARIARADAAYAITKEHCDDMAGNKKDNCLQEAKAARDKAKADAKADRKSANAQNSANEKIAEARKDAGETKREADYRVAVERCDSLAGERKDLCVKDAKARFGK